MVSYLAKIVIRGIKAIGGGWSGVIFACGIEMKVPISGVSTLLGNEDILPYEKNIAF